MATEQQVINFINKIAPMCMDDMKKSKILASLKIVQACVESAYGQSTATSLGNNLYGIKADKYWKGQFVTAMGWEEKNGIKQPKEPMKWRKYSSWQESITDHSNFLKAKRYANIIGCTDYKQACINIRNDGYCTASGYSQLLISIIEKYQLYKYDQQVLNGIKPQPTPQPSPTSKPITPQPAQPIQPSQIINKKITIANGQWNVRQQPNASASVVKIVNAGQTFTSSKIENGWYYINELKGYINLKGISKAEDIKVTPNFITYKIKVGDSWWKIAQEQMGNGARCEELAKYNGMTTKTVIQPNQQIKIPK